MMLFLAARREGTKNLGGGGGDAALLSHTCFACLNKG